MTTAQAGCSLVQQALGSLSPVLVSTFMLTKARLGVVFGAILIGASCCTAISGALTDRWGERKMLLLSAIVMTVALLGATLIVNYDWLVVMAAIYGAGYAACTPAGGRAILAWFERDRGLAMGIRQTGVSLGGLLGAVSLPMVALHGGYRAALVFAALLIAVTSGIAYVLYRESPTVPATGRSVARSMRALIGDQRLLAITLTCMLLSASQFVVNAFLTITAISIVRTTIGLAGSALVVAFFAAICGRLGWGIVSDRVFGGDRQMPLALISGLAAVGAAMLALLGAGAIGPLFCASALLGLTASGWNGLILMAAALSEIGGTERAASALGLGLTGIFAASAIAPWLFGLTADRTSLSIAWGGIALLCTAAAGPVLWLRSRRTATDYT